MTYHLGIDLGTTYCAAATHTDGAVEMVPLGERGPAMPSVLYLGPDDSILAGAAANRHAATDPSRVAREFKRRLGDPTPVMIGGASMAPEELTGRLLRQVCLQVGEARGAAPQAIAMTHPANWGSFKRELLQKSAEMAGIGGVTMITEPQAAAIHYANQERIEPGSVVAVYDLGGGTFDVALLRKEADGGFSILGTPEGLERMGGIDFDEAVYAHVATSLEEVFEDLDPEDGATVAAVARLRQECTQAKEALSSDTEAVIPILLPTVQDEVRVTRAEFEDMIRPSLSETITALERALRSADLSTSDISKVLLVGGSSRIPMISELLSSKLGRPVALDTHPKHAVAMGSALAAARSVGVMPSDPTISGSGSGSGSGVPAVAAAPAAPVQSPASVRPAPPPPPPPAPAQPPAAYSQPGAGTPSYPGGTGQAPTRQSAPPTPANYPAMQQSSGHAAAQQQKNRTTAVAVAVGVIVLLAAAAGFLFLMQEDDTELGDLEVGDCFSGEPSGNLSVVDCTEAHRGELVGVLPPPPELEEAFDETALEAAVEPLCRVEAEEYTGADQASLEGAGWSTFSYRPNLDRWESGDRTSFCVVEQSNGSEHTTPASGLGSRLG